MMASASLRPWLILALAAAVALLYAPSSAVLYAQWSDFINITYTHGWLILPISLAFIILRRRALAAARTAPSHAGQLLLAFAVIAWLVCYRACIQDLHVTIFPALFWLAALAAWGWEVGLLLAFPVAFFYFAVPSWSQLGNPLQELTVVAMDAFLRLTGPRAIIQGDLIHIPNGSFIIEEGCSGLHFLIVGLAVAALHGELRHDSWRTRLVQLLLMSALALLANWVRVYTVIEAGYLTDMHHYLVSVSHYWFGWGVFALALVVFFWLTTWLSPPPASPAAARQPDAPPAASSPAAGEVRGLIVALALLAGLPGVSWALRARQPLPAVDNAPAASAPGFWRGLGEIQASEWQPVFPGADRIEQLAFLGREAERVEVLRVQYQEQQQGAELIGGDSSLLGAQLRWRGSQPVDTPVGRLTETEAARQDEGRSLIWSRYVIADKPILWPLGAQLWYGLRATVGHPTAELNALRSDCAPDCGAARGTLARFLTQARLAR